MSSAGNLERGVLEFTTNIVLYTATGQRLLLVVPDYAVAATPERRSSPVSASALQAITEFHAQPESASRRQRRLVRRHHEQLNLSGPPPLQTRDNLASALVPLRQLLACDSVGVFTCIETLDQSRATGVAAANVEGPAYERAVLVGGECDGFTCVVGDAVLGGLRGRLDDGFFQSKELETYL